MNKKGFTLVEISISVTLLSLVMVFMFKLISIIKTDENSISLETDLLMTKTILSKSINEDIKTSRGIKSLTCTSSLCNIVLNDNNSRTLQVTNDGLVLVYKDTTNNKILITRDLPNDYVFNLSNIETDYLYDILIEIVSHPEYNIEIIDKKSY